MPRSVSIRCRTGQRWSAFCGWRPSSKSGFAKPRCCRALTNAILLAGLICIFGSGGAFATPLVSIQAYWSFTPDLPLPSGITLSCFGSATSLAGGCIDTQSLAGAATPPEELSINDVSGVVLTNNSGETFSPASNEASFTTGFSGFYPSSSGISIDDPVTQSANFTSAVLGPANVADSHGCSIGFAGYSGYGAVFFTPTFCAVIAPDVSYDDLPLQDYDPSLANGLGPGQSATLTYDITLTADFAIVPEPSSWSISAIGLLGLVACCGIAKRRTALPPRIRGAGHS